MNTLEDEDKGRDREINCIRLSAERLQRRSIEGYCIVRFKYNVSMPATRCTCLQGCIQFELLKFKFEY